MKSRDKKDLILVSIIQTYLLDNAPIGLSELNLNLCIPASTIRVYLKRLNDVGFDLFTIEKIASLRQNLIYYRSNEERAYQIYQNDEFVKLLDCGVHRYFKESLEFEPLFKEGFMGLKVDAQFLGEDINIILVSSVYTDYKKILQYIKEAA